MRYRPNSFKMSCLLAACLLASCDEPTPDPPASTVNSRVSAHEASPQAPEKLEPPPVRPSPTAPRDAYTVAEQSASEVETGLRRACERAEGEGGRLLIEFSAPWCGDCRRLAEMKTEPVLSNALAATPHFVVNVGDFDRHEGLLKVFEVRSIARWQVVEASACDAPPAAWPRVKHRTLEPKTGKQITAKELADWLKKEFPAP